jgi:recombination protein RecR
VRGLLQPRRGPALPDLRGRPRDQSQICVVEEPRDVIPIERTGEYRGVYHVLGGALSPIDGIDPRTCDRRALDRVDGEVRRWSWPPTRPRPARRPRSTSPTRCAAQVSVTRLASGLPVGADLEHADEVTLGKALSGRQSLG